MSDGSCEMDEPDGGTPAMGPPGRRRWQVGLRTLFLLMAAIAVWMGYSVNLRDNAALRARIEAMIPIAHELVIDDDAKIAVVKMEPYWYDENRWEIHLPDGSYRLCIATRGVDENGFAPVKKSAAIGAGRHQTRAGDGSGRRPLAGQSLVGWEGAADGGGAEGLEDRRRFDGRRLLLGLRATRARPARCPVSSPFHASQEQGSSSSARRAGRRHPALDRASATDRSRRNDDRPGR